MLIFPRARLVLLAVPKTATTALEAALAPHAEIAISAPAHMKHMPLSRFERHFRHLLEEEKYGRYETVAVIRNPESWLASWWRYRSRPEIAGKPQYAGKLDFDEFARDYLRDPQPEHARVGSQARFLDARQGKAGVDHLFRYEALERLVDYLAERLGMEISLPSVNASPPRSGTLSPETAARLRTALQPDFELWEKALH